MINGSISIKRFLVSYFQNVLPVVVMFLTVVLPGCKTEAPQNTVGSITGTAQLADPDVGTGNAGILMYLAGTEYQARTNREGRYRIDGIPAGEYDLAAEKLGYQTRIIEGVIINPAIHTAESPLAPSTVTLDRTEPVAANDGTTALGSIRGRVLLEDLLDEYGGVRVEVDGTAFVTVSGRDGQYRVLNVEPGSYTLSYYKEGFRPFTTESIEVTTGVIELEDVALELARPGDPVTDGAAITARASQAAALVQPGGPPGPDEKRSVVGVVQIVDEDGEPVTDYSSVAVAINGTDTIAEVNEQGQFRLDGLTSGTYTVIAAMPGGIIAQAPVDLEYMRSASVVLKLEMKPTEQMAGQGVIRGRVVLVDFNDEPLTDSLAGVTVAVAGTQISASTGADGAFMLSGLATGTYTITAKQDGFENGELPGINVAGSSAVEAGEIRLVQKVERPRVLSTDPATGAKDVMISNDLQVLIKFSMPMNAQTVRDAITLTPKTPYTVAIGKGAGPLADDLTAVVTISNDNYREPIRFNADYRLTVADTAANLDGVPMEEPYQFTFKTANPGIISTWPENGAKDVFVDQLENSVLISFNTQLDPDTINERTIRVKPDRGVSVHRTRANDQEKGWTTVRIATQWQADTDYTITITRRLRAINGQALGNTPYTLRFHTAPLEILHVPLEVTR